MRVVVKSINLSGVESYCRICWLEATTGGRKLGGVVCLNPGEQSRSIARDASLLKSMWTWIVLMMLFTTSQKRPQK